MTKHDGSKIGETAKVAGEKVSEGAKSATDYVKAHPGTTAAVIGGIAAAAAAAVGAKLYTDSKRKEEARAELDKVAFPEMRAGGPDVKMDEKA